jgi:hypothetical protein
MEPEPLYRRVIGEAWSGIAEPVRSLHASQTTVRARGHLRIEHGSRMLARVLAFMLRVPRPAAAADTRLVVTPRDGGEHWARTFDGHRLETWQYVTDARELAERYGAIEFRFRLQTAGGSLVYVQQAAALRFGPLGLRIPGPLAPRVEAREDPAGPARVKVAVRVVHPLAGLVIAYDGLIAVEDARA